MKLGWHFQLITHKYCIHAKFSLFTSTTFTNTRLLTVQYSMRFQLIGAPVHHQLQSIFQDRVGLDRSRPENSLWSKKAVVSYGLRAAKGSPIVLREPAVAPAHRCRSKRQLFEPHLGRKSTQSSFSISPDPSTLHSVLNKEQLSAWETILRLVIGRNAIPCLGSTCHTGGSP